jgi:hypothetical protein
MTAALILFLLVPVTESSACDSDRFTIATWLLAAVIDGGFDAALACSFHH